MASQAPEGLGVVLKLLDLADVEPLPDHLFHLAGPGWCTKMHETDEAVEIIKQRFPSNDPLAMPIWCDCAQQKTQATTGRVAATNLPNEHAPKTFETFDQDRLGLWTAVNAAHKFVAGDGPRMLTYTGGTGTGKSHLAEAIARAYLAEGMTVRHEFVPDLCRQMREASSPNSDESADLLLAPAFAAGFLWLDDLGMEKGSAFTAERLTNLVQDRVTRSGLLVVTTNKTREEMREAFGGAYFRLASRLYDIHTKTVRVVEIEAKDFRVEGS